MGYPSFVGADGAGQAELHWQVMPAELKEELLQYIASYQVPADQLDGPCFWYDEKLRVCKHHEHRPNVCRDFRVGGKVCRDWRDHYTDKLTHESAQSIQRTR